MDASEFLVDQTKKIEVVMDKEVFDEICKLIKQKENHREKMRARYREKGTVKNSYKTTVIPLKFDSVRSISV